MSSKVDSFRAPVEGYITQFWGLPEYTDWMDESMSWKETCYIGDWSFLWERRFKGPDALKFLSGISVNNFTQFAVGQGKHIIHCTDAGKVIHEGIVIRLGEEEFMTFGQGSYWADFMFRRGKYNATSDPEDWYNFQVAGPNSLYVLEKASGESLRDINFMYFRKTKIKGRDVIVLRQNMAGELGYELVGPRQDSDEIYKAILEAGQEFSIRRLGGRVVMINHLEACFPTVGKDYLPAIHDETGLAAEYGKELRGLVPPLFTWHNRIAGSFEADDISAWYRSPVELGWAKDIKFDHDFMGRAALEAEVARPKRKIVTLVWNADDVVDVYASLFRKAKPFRYMDIPITERWYMYADKVVKNGKLVGVATSRGYSYYFRQMISLCTIDTELSKPGTKVTVVWGNPGEPQKNIRAEVAPAPYKKDNRRIDVTKLPSYLKK